MTITDDLSALLRHADVVEGSLRRSVGEVDEAADGVLTWTIPSLADGDVATLTYQVKVDEDAFGLDAEGEQAVALGGELLLIGGASGVPDKQCAHDAPRHLGGRRTCGPRISGGVERGPG